MFEPDITIEFVLAISLSAAIVLCILTIFYAPRHAPSTAEMLTRHSPVQSLANWLNAHQLVMMVAGVVTAILFSFLVIGQNDRIGWSARLWAQLPASLDPIQFPIFAKILLAGTALLMFFALALSLAKRDTTAIAFAGAIPQHRILLPARVGTNVVSAPAGNPPTAWRRTRRILEQLSRNLASEYHYQLNILHQIPSRPQAIRAITCGLTMLIHIQSQVQSLLSIEQGPDPDDVHLQLEALASQLTTELTANASEDVHGREALSRLLLLLSYADAALVSTSQNSQVQGQIRIQLPSELLFQAQHSLFPAERLIVASGRSRAGQQRMTALFEVTGERSVGHVRADAERLARALIAMDQSGTHLAAWIHSHPGRGPEATRPSTTDLSQHEEWLQDYSRHLLGVILVEDGWLRLWGDVLNEPQVEIEIKGSGITKEDPNEHLYRFQV